MTSSNNILSRTHQLRVASDTRLSLVSTPRDPPCVPTSRILDARPKPASSLTSLNSSVQNASGRSTRGHVYDIDL